MMNDVASLMMSPCRLMMNDNKNPEILSKKDLGIFIMSASDQAAEGAKRPAVRKLEQAGCLSVIERTAGIDDGGSQGAIRRAGNHHSA